MESEGTGCFKPLFPLLNNKCPSRPLFPHEQELIWFWEEDSFPLCFSSGALTGLQLIHMELKKG